MLKISFIKKDCLDNLNINTTPLRHDEVAKTFLYSHIKKYNPNKKITLNNESEYIYTEKPREYWWNVSIKTATKVPHDNLT